MKARVSIERKPRKAGALLARVTSYFFLAAGIWGLGYATYVVVDAQTYQATEEMQLPTMPPAEGPRVVAEGDVIGEMSIPRLALKTIVVQGESSKILQRAIGHLPGTPLPGEPGNVALAGHRDSYFRPLRNIQPGDVITIKTPDAEFEYQVESFEVVLPSDVQVLQPTVENSLTLVTCFPFYYIGPAPKRFIVHAREIGRLQEQPPIAEAPFHD